MPILGILHQTSTTDALFGVKQSTCWNNYASTKFIASILHFADASGMLKHSDSPNKYMYTRYSSSVFSRKGEFWFPWLHIHDIWKTLKLVPPLTARSYLHSNFHDEYRLLVKQFYTKSVSWKSLEKGVVVTILDRKSGCSRSSLMSNFLRTRLLYRHRYDKVFNQLP